MGIGIQFFIQMMNFISKTNGFVVKMMNFGRRWRRSTVRRGPGAIVFAVFCFLFSVFCFLFSVFMFPFISPWFSLTFSEQRQAPGQEMAEGAIVLLVFTIFD